MFRTIDTEIYLKMNQFLLNVFKTISSTVRLRPPAPDGLLHRGTGGPGGRTHALRLLLALLQRRAHREASGDHGRTCHGGTVSEERLPEWLGRRFQRFSKHPSPCFNMCFYVPFFWRARARADTHKEARSVLGCLGWDGLGAPTMLASIAHDVG